MGRNLLVVVWMLLAAWPARVAADLIVVDHGKSAFAIQIPAEPTAVEMFAADEVAKYVKQMSGVELPIRKGPDALEHTILIRQLKPGYTDVAGLNVNIDPGHWLFTVRENGIVAVGSDTFTTLRAAYAALDSLGCRFLAPQLDHYHDSAEVILKSDTLIASMPTNEWFGTRSRFKFCKIYVEEGHSHTPENLAQIVEWMPKVGFNTLVVPTNYQGNDRVKWDNFRAKVAPECQKRGITIEVGGHGYQNFINAEMEDGKIFQQHPEWFGMAGGQRRKEHGRVICTSNPDAVAYLIKNLLAYVKDRPEIQIYDLWPPDGAKWCECDECKKLGTPPNRQAILMSQVKEATAKVRPDLRLEMIAYAAALQPPEHAKVDKSILVDFCPIGQQFDHQIFDSDAAKNKEYVDGLTAWRKAFDGDISIYSYYRKYAWDSLPVIIPHYMQKDLQWYAKLPVQGVSTYAEPDDWRTYELNHYVLAALAWDVNADVDGLVKKFCDARYGNVSETAVKVFTTLEQVTRNYCSVPNSSLKSAEEIKAASSRIKEAKDAVEAASKQTTTAGYAWSLGALELPLEYVSMDLDVQYLRATGASKDEIRKKIGPIHDFVNDSAEVGVFLVKDHRLSLERMLKRYGVAEPK